MLALAGVHAWMYYAGQRALTRSESGGRASGPGRHSPRIFEF